MASIILKRPKRFTQGKLIKQLIAMEETGACFWQRHGDTFAIYFRMAHGNDSSGWENAHLIGDYLGGSLVRDISPDPISGHVRMEVCCPKRRRRAA